MSEQITQPKSVPVGNPAVFKVLDDGTVLYNTAQQAEAARQQLQASKPAGTAVKKLSQVKFGELHLAKDGQMQAYSLGSLVEFQCTGLIVVIVVLTSLSLICSLIGRLVTALEGSSAVTSVPAPSPARLGASVPNMAGAGIHPGLSDQQLVVLLTAAASEALGEAVRVERFRPLTSRDLNWAAKGRSDLQSHRLK